MKLPPILILAGPAAAGKDTLLRHLVDSFGFGQLVSVTDRQPRAGETDGVGYHFVDKKVFSMLSINKQFVEEVSYLDRRYGTTFFELSKAYKRPCVLIAEKTGINHLRDYGVPVCVCLVKTKSIAILRERIIARGDSTEEVIARIDRAEKELSEIKSVMNFEVVNDKPEDLERVAADIRRFFIQWAQETQEELGASYCNWV